MKERIIEGDQRHGLRRLPASSEASATTANPFLDPILRVREVCGFGVG
jgi:hypothetical protein